MNDIIRLGELQRWGITPNGFYAANSEFLISVTAIAIVLVGFSGFFFIKKKEVKFTEVLGLAITVGGFFVAYFEWKQARYEASLKEYYDRLDVANRRLERIYDAGVRTSVSERPEALKAVEASASGRETLDTLIEAHGDTPWSPDNESERFEAMRRVKGPHPFEMWVFTELDNLEYMIRKYRAGYADEELLDRSLNAFRSRCAGQPFASIAAYWAVPVRAGYTEETMNFVQKSCARTGQPHTPTRELRSADQEGIELVRGILAAQLGR